MMLHGEKDHLASAHQIEHEIVVHHEFAQVACFAEECAQFLGQRLCFCRFDGMSEERAPGLRESAQRGNGLFEKMVEESAVGRPAMMAEKCLDGCQID